MKKRGNVDVYVVLTFDMEADVANYSHDYRGIREGTPVILDILKRNRVENATFLYTVDAADADREILKDISRKGYEIGCHTYEHDIIGDDTFLSEGRRLMNSEIERRIELATEQLANLAGYAPVSFRAPKLFMSTDAMRMITKNGYKVDSSFSTARFKKNFWPYLASVEDWTRPDATNGRILELPLLSFFSEQAELAEDYSIEAGEFDFFGFIRRFNAKKCVDLIVRNSQFLIEQYDKSKKYLVYTFYVHPWEFVNIGRVWDLGMQIYTFSDKIAKGLGEKMTKEFDCLIGLLKSELNPQFVSMRQFFDIWNRKYRE